MVHFWATLQQGLFLSQAPHRLAPERPSPRCRKPSFRLAPKGEKPTSASSVTRSDAEMAQIREMGATAAIVMHYGGNDWSQAQINGLQTQFAAMAIEVIAVTDAGFRAQKQLADIETIMAQSPDLIVSIPTDPVVTAAAFRAASPLACILSSWTTCPRALLRAPTMSPQSRPTPMATASPPPI